MSIYLYLFASLSVCLSVSVCLFMCICVHACLSLSISTCIFWSLPMLCAYVSVCLLVCVCAYVSVCLLVCVYAYAVCLSVCLFVPQFSPVDHVSACCITLKSSAETRTELKVLLLIFAHLILVLPQ